MTKLLEDTISRLRELPDEAQDMVARQLVCQLDEEPEASDFEAIAIGRKEFENGEFVTLPQCTMPWGVALASRARRQLRRLSHATRDQISSAFTDMSANPLAEDARFLRGARGALRRRIGDWRILYEVDRAKQLVMVTAVKRRGSNTY